MKQQRIIVFLAFILSFVFGHAQTTAIPDANFENYLETHAEDGTLVDIGDAISMGDGIANNGLVLTERIENVTLLDVSNLEISNLIGIEDFLSLETLICSDNALSTIDVSNNVNLTSLLCGSNQLTDLNLDTNTNLESLNCSDNQIQNLNVANNLVLKNLTASGNRLSVIDVSNNTDLSLLAVSNNRLAGELTIANNTNLERLFCASNQISILNLANNNLLRDIDVSNNSLTDLDLSNINTVVCPDPQTDPVTICQDLSSINVSRNQLLSLIIANGYNDLISVFNASDNPDLFCIQIDAAFTPSNWVKDDWAYYSGTTCVDIYTYVPDDNFEQALIDLGYDDVIDNLVLTANIDTVIDLNISNASISSLVGIEDFNALEVLDCSMNTIESIDLSNNTALQEINISDNNLVVIDLSLNTSLVTVNCSGNILDSIDVNDHLALTDLDCSNNYLTTLDISNNLMLLNLDCSNNSIEQLDVTSNSVLTSLMCHDNNLFALNLNNGNNAALTTFDATNNTNLFCIVVDDVAFANGAAGWQKDAMATYSLNCGTYIPDDNFEQALIDQGIDSDGTLNNFVPTADVNGLILLDISSLLIADLTGIEDFVALQDLNCSNNNLSSLNLLSNTALEVLDCSINFIEELDLTLNTALTSILCSNNALRTLNIENGNNAAIAVFNSTDNPNLYCVNVDDAIVGNIPGSWQKDAFTSYDGDCANNRYTAIPDAFFEQALIDLGYDNMLDGQVLTANIEHIQSLDVSNESISDLIGIKDFRSLVELDCSSNFLEELDVSDMIYLERLNCSSNYLLTNDINDTNGLFNTTGTISLLELYCADNNLNTLDVSQNTSLELLDCSDNNLDILNVSGNTVLKNLNCSNNNLTNLDVSSNAILQTLNCDSNALDNLLTPTITNNTLANLSCVNNNLPSLLVNNYLALEQLNCGSNELTQLNVTSNTQLVFLSATNNQISDIDLSNNINLVEVLVSQNGLAELNTNANTLLKFLSCDFNDITQLNLVANTILKSLKCSSNALTEIDLSSNINLIEVNFSANMLATITLSNNLGDLKILDVSNNQLEGDLDLTTIAISACVFQPNQTEFCPENISINISNNLFDFVNIQNGINTDITSFNASGNPNLDCIQVDDSNNVSANWIKDDAAEYSEDCNFGETYVPDDNFEQTLIDLGYDSGPLNDYVLTANIEGLISLDVSGNAIADFTGIEDFIALEVLNCSNNNIIQLDLSSNLNLTNLNCANNQLSQLDITTNTALTIVDCSSNLLTDLDVINNTALTELNISDNDFTSFIPSEVSMLQIFNCDNNAIVELNFQQNLNLTSLNCQSNALEILNIQNGQNGILTNLNAINNLDLNCIQTDTGSVPAGAIWTIDATAQFAIECFFGQTYVPDDNFEQALIDLGYDSGPLDDYVFTENIQDLTFLNVSGSEIEDPTGIEDFVGLLSLNMSENLIQSIDLSNNTFISSLNISDNLIGVIDVSVMPNLTTLNVSNNSIDELDVDTNTSLINLNIANNLITAINVSALFSLEDFSCAFNEISSLDFTQNPNLNILFCQSNLLVGDQLNLQNDNNENIQIFNATNNLGLGCILVDDPVVVINNIDGTYDNWSKDPSTSYQIICEDADNDGVPNDEDLCPGTEFGVPVDLFGCAIIDLPNDNFMITITGETCLNSNDGKIRIETQELYNYTVSLFSEDIIEPTGEDFYQEYNFTNDVDIFNLLAGTYDMCIIIEEWPNYESCYTIVITEPDPLEVFASRAVSGNEVSVDMSGSLSYNIEFNGNLFTTHNSNLTLQLQYGVNLLKVSTDLDCQGVFEKEIFVSGDFTIYPNPFNDIINIVNGTLNDKVTVNVYSTYGQLIASKTYINEGVEVRLDTSDFPAGIYIVTAQSEQIISTYKMVKK